jgi:hypothetical protein
MGSRLSSLDELSLAGFGIDQIAAALALVFVHHRSYYGLCAKLATWVRYFTTKSQLITPEG